ncbi:hypothetical protein DTO006G1_9468 [Penicillium roqueforti]|nr:hypothetical protein DTO006G1_9468 [Penicillium roqueforti]KAI3192433.1 hypothetical protein CBS147311_9283 [Penicillium roqueforti]KAI3248932.1 hypothetical protein DTO006G7_9652 [Penicillium roqueforti]KAI3283637.1 hypothetical protein DTO002I6_9521 [Penicillium roqueforti]
MSMPAKPDEAPPQSYTEEGSILDIVDELRTVSVSKYVHLPQMIICGSKSNAKRSVIESISGVSFPSRNDFYTGFVTEIILRYDLTPRFKVSIRPGPTRISEGDLWHLESFDPPVHDNTEQSVALIEQATQLVKFSLEDGFSDDVMRVEVSGPDKPDLTLIDMPRLFFADGIDNGGREKTPSRRTIENYVLNQRCIILPVVSAKIDICPQKLIDFADKYDPNRGRILEIITHLDTLEEPEEEALWLNAIKDRHPKCHWGCTWCVPSLPRHATC